MSSKIQPKILITKERIDAPFFEGSKRFCRIPGKIWTRNKSRSSGIKNPKCFFDSPKPYDSAAFFENDFFTNSIIIYQNKNFKRLVLTAGRDDIEPVTFNGIERIFKKCAAKLSTIKLNFVKSVLF